MSDAPDALWFFSFRLYRKKLIQPPNLHTEPCPAQLVPTLVPSCCRYWSRCWTSWTHRCRSAWSCVLSASSRLNASALAPPAGASARVLSQSDRHKHIESEADVRRKAGVPTRCGSVAHSSSLLGAGAQVKTFLCTKLSTRPNLSELKNQIRAGCYLRSWQPPTSFSGDPLEVCRFFAVSCRSLIFGIKS